MAESAWNSLEVVKVAVSAVTPVTVAVLGALFARALKRAEGQQWFSQKLVEKRIEVISLLLPELNDLLCYYTWVGEWQSIKPPDVIARKRHLDRIFFANRSFFSGPAAEAYKAFMDGLFQTYVAPGQGPRLRTGLISRHGDRRVSLGEDWLPEWNALFLAEDAQTPRGEVRRRYDALAETFGSEIGVKNS